MDLVRRSVPLVCLLVLLAAPARAATLVHEYALRGSLADNLGGNSLTGLGGQITALGYVFAANQGLTLSSPAFSASSFSLELSFHFTDTSGWRKIADFHDRTLDTGLYQLNGDLNFFPVVDSGAVDFTPGVDVHVVLTRDGVTNAVTGYVNGQQRFSFLDTGQLAAVTGANNTINFFIDDTVQGTEASGGTVNYIRIYNGALTASEVSAAFAAGAPLAVPEPSTLGLLGAGVAGLAMAARTFRRRAAAS